MNRRSFAIMHLFLNHKISDLDKQILEYSKVAQFLQNQLTSSRVQENMGQKIATNIAITSNASQIISEVADLADEKQLLFEMLQLDQIQEIEEEDQVQRSEISYEEFQVAMGHLIEALEREEYYEACQLILKYRDRIDKIRSEMSYAVAS